MKCIIDDEDETQVTLVGGTVLYNVHTRTECDSRLNDRWGRHVHCPIHRPSPHHMREWDMVPVVRTGSGVLMYRRCEHSCLHPDPDSRGQGVMAQHDCDGCCDGAVGQIVIFE